MNMMYLNESRGVYSTKEEEKNQQKKIYERTGEKRLCVGWLYDVCFFFFFFSQARV